MYNIHSEIIHDNIFFVITDTLFIIINENGLVYRKIKINPLLEIVYEFMKTIVKTKDIKTLKKHFREANTSENPFNSVTYGLLKRVS